MYPDLHRAGNNINPRMDSIQSGINLQQITKKSASPDRLCRPDNVSPETV